MVGKCLVIGTEIKDNIKTDFSELSSGSEKNSNADICVSIHFLLVQD